MIKSGWENPTANITLNGERLKDIPLRSEIGQQRPLWLFLLNIVLDVIAKKLGKKKGLKEKGDGVSFWGDESVWS